MPTNTAAAARLAELHDYFLSEFDRDAHDNAFAILREIRAQAVGATCDLPIASPAVRLGLWQKLYDRARQFGQTEFALRIMREMRKEDCR